MFRYSYFSLQPRFLSPALPLFYRVCLSCTLFAHPPASLSCCIFLVYFCWFSWPLMLYSPLLVFLSCHILFLLYPCLPLVLLLVLLLPLRCPFYFRSCLVSSLTPSQCPGCFLLKLPFSLFSPLESDHLVLSCSILSFVFLMIFPPFLRNTQDTLYCFSFQSSLIPSRVSHSSKALVVYFTYASIHLITFTNEGEACFN